MAGNVHKQILRNAKLHPGERGKKTELTGGSPLRFALDYTAIQEEKKKKKKKKTATKKKTKEKRRKRRIRLG